mgnify:CR=1 FL=1
MIKKEEIIFRGAKNKPAVCDIFSYLPSNIEEASLGNLYIIAELKTEDESSSLVNLLIPLIKREYYSAPHRGPLTSLESCLKKSNQILNELANQGNLNWLGKLNFICAVLNKEQDLFLAQAGDTHAWLLREGQLVNLNKKAVPSPKKPHPAKTFQSLISGKITCGDKLIFATSGISNLFSPPGFKQLACLPKIEMISDQINKVMREQKKPPILGLIILEVVAEDHEKTTPLNEENQKKFITPPIDLEEILK